VHYGLTRWLAVNAGFTPAAAELIASADLSADLGSFNPATWAVGFHILILGDVGASKRVQQLHFPSYGPVPGDPGKRSVPQRSSRALDWLTKDTQFATSSASESAELEDFGLALHSLQDSWSHEGEPDVAFRCFGLTPRSQLSWAHPIDRGGWAVHDADLTYLWKSDLTNRPIDMAHATFDALVAYGGTHPNAQQHQPPKWDVLESRVKKFIEAGTKNDKKAWFESDPDIPFSSYKNQSFINGLSLPTSSATLRAIKFTCNTSADVIADVRRLTEQIPPAVRDFYDKFFEQWLIARRTSAVVESMVDLTEIGHELEGLGFAKRARDWSRKFLTMWLLSDHGFVNENGHGVPTAPGFEKLPLDPVPNVGPSPREPYKSVDEAILAPGSSSSFQIDAVEWPRLPGTSYVATFRFRNQTHDTLVLVAKQQASQPIRLVRMFWLID
jgi:hypothetical protein